MSDWVVRRFFEPIERLEKENFTEIYNGVCKYCDAGTGPGIVKIPRNPTTLELMPDRCSCLLCGQHYYIDDEDLEQFIGPAEYQWRNNV